MLNKKSLLLVLAFASQTGVADETPVAGMEKLGPLNEDITVMEAMLEKSTLKAQIEKVKAGPVDENANKEAIENKKKASEDPIDLIVIKSIEGYHKKKIASAMYEDGASFQVRVGDAITEKWKVKDISLNTVLLVSTKNGKDTKRLAIGYKPKSELPVLDAFPINDSIQPF